MLLPKFLTEQSCGLNIISQAVRAVEVKNYKSWGTHLGPLPGNFSVIKLLSLLKKKKKRITKIEMLSSTRNFSVRNPSGIVHQILHFVACFLGADSVGFIRFSKGFATPYLRLRIPDLGWLPTHLVTESPLHCPYFITPIFCISSEVLAQVFSEATHFLHLKM